MKKAPKIAIIENEFEEEKKEEPAKQEEEKLDDYTLSLPTISLAELAKHNTWEDQWTSVDGLVYDVTKFAPQHPGGKRILQGAGNEATEVFYKSHGPLNLSDTPVAKCVIGRLCRGGEEQTYVATTSKYANKTFLDIF